ncbi:glial cell line-derived neurotrophic factor-like isoform 3-T4 [Morphnus guianensis]
MKLWDVVAVCVVLLNTVSTSPLPTGKMPPKGPPSVVEGPEDDLSPISLLPPYAVQSDSNMPEDYPDQFDEAGEKPAKHSHKHREFQQKGKEESKGQTSRMCLNRNTFKCD